MVDRVYAMPAAMPQGIYESQLQSEINGHPSIVPFCSNVSQGGGNLTITFAGALSLAEATVLDGDAIAPALGLMGDHVPVAKVSVNTVNIQIQEAGYQLCDRDFKLTTCKLTANVEDLKMNPVTLLEEDWNEMVLVNVYKLGMVPCVDQADADINGILTIWNYRAIDQVDGTTQIKYNVKDGIFIADPAIITADRFKHRVYAIAAPDLGQAYYVRLFDGYGAAHPSGAIDAKSPNVKLLDPTPAPGAANVIRLYIVHPPGQSHEHMLRLTTYRPLGTF